MQSCYITWSICLEQKQASRKKRKSLEVLYFHTGTNGLCSFVQEQYFEKQM